MNDWGLRRILPQVIHASKYLCAIQAFDFSHKLFLADRLTLTRRRRAFAHFDAIRPADDQNISDADE
jgi:hypothetical protein